jgi:hypothetical protein
MLIAKGDDQADKRRREVAALRVLDRFGLRFPDCRLLCFLDDEDWWQFKAENGIANRGFYSRVRARDRDWQIAPTYILEELFPHGAVAFDGLVYLHGSTCSDDIGLTMTLEHELQHFVQRTTQTRLWAANTLVQDLTKSAISELGLKWCDVPHEREARIVSKLTAQTLFGDQAVLHYIAAKIAEHLTPEDTDDWTCIKALDTSSRYDLASETKLFFLRLRNYRQQLQAALQRFQSIDPDFAGIDLDALLSGTDG